MSEQEAGMTTRSQVGEQVSGGIINWTRNNRAPQCPPFLAFTLLCEVRSETASGVSLKAYSHPQLSPEMTTGPANSLGQPGERARTAS